MFVAEKFIANLIKIYGKHPVSIDGTCLFVKGWLHPLQINITIGMFVEFL